jgi:hypothetical protein
MPGSAGPRRGRARERQTIIVIQNLRTSKTSTATAITASPPIAAARGPGEKPDGRALMAER